MKIFWIILKKCNIVFTPTYSRYASLLHRVDAIVAWPTLYVTPEYRRVNLWL